VAWLIIVAVGLSGTGLAVFLKLRHGDDAPVAHSRLRGLRAESVSPCRPSRCANLRWGHAYAVWIGIGAAGRATVGIIFLGDAVSPLKLVSIGLILAGVVGLNLSGVTPP
jgi:quaternary ammonium compound-resistance protein SugE